MSKAKCSSESTGVRRLMKLGVRRWEARIIIKAFHEACFLRRNKFIRESALDMIMVSIDDRINRAIENAK